MSVRTVLTQLLLGEEREVVVECRQCGETLASGTNTCPQCGSDEIERFEISE